MGELLGSLDAAQAVCVLRSTRHFTEDNFYYFLDHKDMKLPDARLTVSVDENKQLLTVTADRFARMVKIELEADLIVMDDNFFDLLPNQPKTVRISRAEGKAIPWSTLAVSAINSVRE